MDGLKLPYVVGGAARYGVRDVALGEAPSSTWRRHLRGRLVNKGDTPEGGTFDLSWGLVSPPPRVFLLLTPIFFYFLPR